MNEHAGDDRSRGIYQKYRVERTDGKPLGPCVVLELKDPYARTGILAWAAMVGAAGYDQLAADARRWVEDAETPCGVTYERNIELGYDGSPCSKPRPCPNHDAVNYAIRCGLPHG
jgi:hypothetical protein